MIGIDPMIRMLEDIWIMRREGTVLYHRMADENIDEQLLGSLMSAIESFAQKINKGGLSSFQIGPRLFVIRKEHELFFLASCASNANVKKAKDALVFLSEFFLYTYDAELHVFKGDVRPFKNFEKKLHESMDFHWILT
jgi:hypothetical protein